MPAAASADAYPASRPVCAGEGVVVFTHGDPTVPGGDELLSGGPAALLLVGHDRRVGVVLGVAVDEHRLGLLQQSSGTSISRWYQVE